MALTNLGLAQSDAGAGDDAVHTQTRAYTIFGAALGPTHTSTLLAGRRLAVALALAAVGQPKQAKTLLDKVLPAAASRAAGHPADWARIATDAATVYTAAGEAETARQWRERAGQRQQVMRASDRQPST